MANTNGNGHGLPPELIAQLMAKSRNRGFYGVALKEFMEGEDAAVNPFEVWPLELNGKNPTTVAQGFRKAATEAEILDSLKIIQSEDQVYILHMERASVVVEA